MKQKVLLTVLTALLLFCNVSMHQNSIGTLLADFKNDITINISSTSGSSSSSGSTGDNTNYFSTSEQTGDRECGTKEIRYFKTMLVRQSDGSYEYERVFQDADIVICEIVVKYSNIITNDKEEVVLVSRMGSKEIECKSFSLSKCTPKQLPCENQGFDCSYHSNYN